MPTGAAPEEAGEHLTADAEGLTIAYVGPTSRTLLASSQGDSTFAAYRIERDGLRYTGGFQVGTGNAADSVKNSDGAAVTTTPLGGRYPHGLLVVHDGENTPTVPGDDGEPRPNTNFKLLRWDQVARAIRHPHPASTHGPAPPQPVWRNRHAATDGNGFAFGCLAPEPESTRSHCSRLR